MLGTITVLSVSMKVLALILLLTLTTSLHAAIVDSVDEVAFQKQKKKIGYVRDGQLRDLGLWNEDERLILIEKLQIKGSWKYGFDEWILLLHGIIIRLEYDKDEEYGSNGGVAIA